MEKRTVSTHEFSEYEDRYQIPAFLSLLFFFAGLILPTQAKTEHLDD